jgi:hypothetical protein
MGMALPPACRHGLTLRSHEKKVRGCGRPPSRAWRVSRTRVGGHSVTELTPASSHSSLQWQGWAPHRELAEQRRGVILRRVVAQLCRVRALNARTHVRVQVRS